ncbi:hypothetical protein KV097_18900, partial [Mumia sp. zg.B17]|nr:hypothetical protein [Mumia sp. zg.B17]MBW9211782.1 hypothetical protein [Mumia sp. zg.B21]
MTHSRTHNGHPAPDGTNRHTGSEVRGLEGQRGAFDDLGQLEAGTETYDKATLAEKSARLFRQKGRPRLLLITCEDWDGTGYRSNTV